MKKLLDAHPNNNELNLRNLEEEFYKKVGLMTTKYDRLLKNARKKEEEYLNHTPNK